MGHTPSDSSYDSDVWDTSLKAMIEMRKTCSRYRESKTTVTEVTTDGRSQTGGTAITSASQEDIFEPDISVCLSGWDAGVEWVVAPPEPRIKESNLTADEKRNDAILGKKIVFDPYDVIEVMKMVVPYLKSESMLIDDVPFDIAIVADLHGQTTTTMLFAHVNTTFSYLSLEPMRLETYEAGNLLDTKRRLQLVTIVHNVILDQRIYFYMNLPGIMWNAIRCDYYVWQMIG
ncbi:hypothetical protein PRIPAC_76680 [Pristionchus pacificus]|uniref:Uncharacterized protein n=1 Tax=Pristionchus pacificus TaxID=54126 RepID=A0A2A6B549_PRIPA|nr:hypothetical protein PRIPAC_76680 [Pristionchus pacificus]|eukprot:PDM61015.1 hypothetical protein PRIPAC_54821 [Pristionchus pacificus]